MFSRIHLFLFFVLFCCLLICYQACVLEDIPKICEQDNDCFTAYRCVNQQCVACSSPPCKGVNDASIALEPKDEKTKDVRETEIPDGKENTKPEVDLEKEVVAEKCIAKKEECNGKDDDCDGIIDNGCDRVSNASSTGSIFFLKTVTTSLPSMPRIVVGVLKGSYSFGTFNHTIPSDKSALFITILDEKKQWTDPILFLGEKDKIVLSGVQFDVQTQSLLLVGSFDGSLYDYNKNTGNATLMRENGVAVSSKQSIDIFAIRLSVPTFKKDWVFFTQSPNNAYAFDAVLTKDKVPNLLIAGAFDQQIQLGAKLYSSAGKEDGMIFQLKIQDGIPLVFGSTNQFIHQVGGEEKDEIHQVRLDALGNYYISGIFSQDVSNSKSSKLKCKQNTFAPTQDRDYFLQRLDLKGVCEWMQVVSVSVFYTKNDNIRFPTEDLPLSIEVKNKLVVSVYFSDSVKTILGKLVTPKGTVDSMIGSLNLSDGRLEAFTFVEGGFENFITQIRIQENDQILLTGLSRGNTKIADQLEVFQEKDQTMFSALLDKDLKKVQWMKQATVSTSSSSMEAFIPLDLLKVGNEIVLVGTYFQPSKIGEISVPFPSQHKTGVFLWSFVTPQ